MIRDPRGVPIFKEVGLTVELGRLQYNGNTVKVYLPQRVRDALRLDPQVDNALIIVYDNENGTLILIHNNKLLDVLKPLIYTARKNLSKVQKASIKSL
jgi:hypothetical protein